MIHEALFSEELDVINEVGRCSEQIDPILLHLTPRLVTTLE